MKFTKLVKLYKNVERVFLFSSDIFFFDVYYIPIPTYDCSPLAIPPNTAGMTINLAPATAKDTHDTSRWCSRNIDNHIKPANAPATVKHAPMLAPSATEDTIPLISSFA